MLNKLQNFISNNLDNYEYQFFLLKWKLIIIKHDSYHLISHICINN